MLELPESVRETVEKISQKLAGRPKLCKMFAMCFVNTLETTVRLMPDGTTFVITGDIPAMWLRDSSAQVSHYLPLAADDDKLRGIIAGLIRRQVGCITSDPYANAFNCEASGKCYSKSDLTLHSPWVWERKYELDSLCYPMWLAGRYWRITGSTDIFTDAFLNAMRTVLRVWKIEQHHEECSDYRFERPGKAKSETLCRDGKGSPVGYTGMIWSGFRPSDDACRYHYMIPSNMFASSVLIVMEKIARTIYKDEPLAREARTLKCDIDRGIGKFGVCEHPRFGRIYAYETDGLGHFGFMDDANAPSLLSIPYFGFADIDDPVYRNTRRFVLSDENPYFYRGSFACGVGSPHTPTGYIWHVSLCMQALTSSDEGEINDILDELENTDDGTGYMHEGFDPDDPSRYTRPWFAWANSLFGELIYRLSENAVI
jgi:uncharacterized protein